MSRFALEKNRLFPTIAWTVCIGFTVFVYMIVQDLKESTKELESATNRLEHLLSQPLNETTDFQQ